MGIKITPNKDNEGFISKLMTLNEKAEGVAKKAVYDGAGVVADAVKAATPRDTGDLAGSVGITKIIVSADVVSANVGFSGLDSKGVSNVLKARALESGTSRMRKRPFFRKAVNGAQGKALAAMTARVNIEINKMMKGV